MHKVDKDGIVHNIEDEYTDVFQGIGKLGMVHKIQLEDNYKPVIHAPRKVPLSLREKLKTELQRLEELDIIETVEEPTGWVHSLVIVEKQDKLRLCIDPKELNRYVKREHFQLPTRGEIFGDLAGAKYFSKLDASSGFWQVCLDKESSRICTFNTPFGRYSFKRLPFGLTSAPEVFHRTIHQIFERAIKNMPPPTDKEGVQRFLGMINYVGKFVPNLTAHTAQMRSLLCKTTEWCWNSNHQKEFDELKLLIAEAPVLRGVKLKSQQMRLNQA